MRGRGGGEMWSIMRSAIFVTWFNKVLRFGLGCNSGRLLSASRVDWEWNQAEKIECWGSVGEVVGLVVVVGFTGVNPLAINGSLSTFA